MRSHRTSSTNTNESLTTYANQIKANGGTLDLFPETKAEKEVCFYSYERKTESYKGKDGQGVHYTMTARVDKKEKLSVVENNLLQIFSRYLKHRCMLTIFILFYQCSKKDFQENILNWIFQRNFLCDQNTKRSLHTFPRSNTHFIVQFFAQEIPSFRYYF